MNPDTYVIEYIYIYLGYNEHPSWVSTFSTWESQVLLGGRASLISTPWVDFFGVNRKLVQQGTSTPSSEQGTSTDEKNPGRNRVNHGLSTDLSQHLTVGGLGCEVAHSTSPSRPAMLKG